LMQTDGRRIQLLPAWPANWTADFRTPRSTGEWHVEDRKVTRLVVTPPDRAKDVIVVKAQYQWSEWRGRSGILESEGI
jgi:alpha-L-fucosidase 2